MKTKIAFLISLLMVFVLVTGCSTITKMVTGRVIEDYLEDEEDGPKEIIDTAVKDLLLDITVDNQEVSTTDIYDYEWNLKTSSVKASVGDPPGKTSGILTAKDIDLKYSYTIEGEPTDDEDDLTTIKKNGELRFKIDSMVYDEDDDKLVSLSETKASHGNESPDISNLSKSHPPVEITANISNVENKNPKAIVVINFNSYPMELSENSIEYISNISLNNPKISGIVAVNRSILADKNTDETGFGSVIFSIP